MMVRRGPPGATPTEPETARHIPVLIKSKIFIGSININLQDAEWVEPAPRT